MGHLYKLSFPNGKAYIGITTKTPNERFRNHMKTLRHAKANGPSLYRAWRKYGAPTLTALAIVEDSDLYETEKRAIQFFGTLAPGGYNLTAGGEASPSLHPEVRKKLSAAMMGVAQGPLSTAHKEKIAAALTGMKRSAETRAKVSATKTGIKRSEETKSRISASLSGRKKKTRSAEHRAKLSVAMTGKKHSAATKSKLSAAKTGRKLPPRAAGHRANLSLALAGRKFSVETRAKMSASAKACWAERAAEKSSIKAAVDACRP